MNNDDYPDPPRTDHLELAKLSEADDPTAYEDLWGTILDEEVFETVDEAVEGIDAVLAGLDTRDVDTDDAYLSFYAGGVWVGGDDPLEAFPDDVEEHDRWYDTSEL